MHDCRLDENEVQDVSHHHFAGEAGFVVFVQLYFSQRHGTHLENKQKKRTDVRFLQVEKKAESFTIQLLFLNGRGSRS